MSGFAVGLLAIWLLLAEAVSLAACELVEVSFVAVAAVATGVMLLSLVSRDGLL